MRSISTLHICLNLAEDLDIHPLLESRDPVKLCLVIVCPTKRESKQRPKFLVRIPLYSIVHYSHSGKHKRSEDDLISDRIMTSEGDLSFPTQIGRGSDVRPTSPNLTMF